ncbi:TniB family NTP-binding protein [Caballeronia novacaledonica]|nr:TniB family NTP-binding protein [Caballeronia novacaledonica]
MLADRWIDYPRATDALQLLERLHQTPRRERMPFCCPSVPHAKDEEAP